VTRQGAGPRKQVTADTRVRRQAGLATTRQQQVAEVRRVHKLLRNDRLAAAMEDRGMKQRPCAKTSEVAGKAKGDVIAKYVAMGRLHDGHRIAAEQVMEVYGALQRSLFPSSNYTPRVQAGGGGKKGGSVARQDFIDRMSPREARLFWDIYRPWSLEMSHQRYGGQTHLAIIMAVVGDNWTLAQVDRVFHLRRGGPSMTILADGLYRYCEIARIG
jgi:hypothetical protein